MIYSLSHQKVSFGGCCKSLVEVHESETLDGQGEVSESIDDGQHGGEVHHTLLHTRKLLARQPGTLQELSTGRTWNNNEVFVILHGGDILLFYMVGRCNYTTWWIYITLLHDGEILLY